MFSFSLKNDWDLVFAKLNKINDEIPRAAKKIIIKSAARMDKAARDHLASQGRGGYPPPLSGITKIIYDIDGEPDGSGIHNHMELAYYQDGKRFVAVLGILEGKPSMIARVQNEGAVIPVTEKMRAYFAARFGIGLKKETTHLIVPGRHFWEESWKIAKSEAVKELSLLFKNI